MAIDTPPASARQNAMRSRNLRSLRELPLRRPEPPPAADAAVRWDRIGMDCYEVTVDERTVGYIEVVGAVFVVLAGARYDRAVEVLQTLDFATAVARVVPREARTPRHR